MKVKVAINGFGRIGRLTLRALIEKNLLGHDLEFIVNDLVPATNLAYLLQYDSVHGRFSGKVEVDGDNFIKIRYQDRNYLIETLSEKVLPKDLPWKEKNVDIVIESTGLFTKKELAQGHLEAGAKKVIISAPSSDDVKTVLIGVNSDSYQGEELVSNASCTTNCLGPLVYVLLKEGIGLEEGLMTTIHAYTASQSLVDGPTRKSLRDGRAGAFNIIPASTGAAKAMSRVLPELEGKLTGMAFRVPVIDVSCVDLTFKPQRKTSLEEINSLILRASKTYLRGILEYIDEDLVSSDFIGNTHSCIYDSKASIELNSEFFKLVAWYDNEWGYSNRMVDLLDLVIKRSN
ncbi:MAG: glyceraldehyde-3-phosphate dehydrogenase [Candidatus Dojkabacteria bacterium]|nr:MAG: glyceraldehyde-3-phosphate dehydrogenase [Candidatus Dojkabacteria bacterium]